MTEHMSVPPSDKSAAQRLEDAANWWQTSIVDIQPGSIAFRGYAIQDLIGRVSYPAMVWLMLRGELPLPWQAGLLEATLVAGVDHGPHAPSIAASRMAVSCGLPLNGAMASAINMLDDVHGGAGQQCMELMQQIAGSAAGREASDAEIGAGLDRFIAEHGKIIPGFGHRWHGVDPRAVRLLALVRQAQQRGEIDGRFARIGQGIERIMQARKGTPIPMNIDGATAAIYLELGFAPPLGRGLFILSRSVGILAHAWEQTQQGQRLKGPMSPSIPYRYTGEPRRELNTAPARPNLEDPS
jgi:citrate synthase